MYKIEEIDKNNVHLLDQFLQNKLPSTFRYFNSRTSDIIKNHIVTLLMVNNNVPIAYAHVDYDGTKYWLGICVLEEYQGNGYGKQIVEHIINHAKVKLIPALFLTVDKNNFVAKNLYEKYNFKIIEELNSCYLMARTICSN